MIPFPNIQIRQTYAQLGYNIERVQFEQKQPRADVNMQQIPAKLSITSPRGELTIDQTRAWDALGVGPVTEAMNRIYDQAQNLFLQNLARKVEQGNHLADIHTGANAIADNAQELLFSFPEFDYYGYASSGNVDLHYTAHEPIIDIELGGVELEAQANAPELFARQGMLNFYMLQYAKVEIIPPEIDMKI